MKYKNIVEAVFIERPNRFIAFCDFNGEIVKCHVKNTGRCRELLVENTKVFLQDHRNDENSSRKTNFSLISLFKENCKTKRIFNIDSQIPNAAVFEGLNNKTINLFNEQKPFFYEIIQREKTFGNSRFDIYVESGGKKAYIEVKGVTLEENGIFKFPDAPTQRGLKHVNELIKAKQDGYFSFIIFVIQTTTLKNEYFTPNVATDSEFAQALKSAEKAGVKILCYDCDVTLDEMKILKEVTVKL